MASPHPAERDSDRAKQLLTDAALYNGHSEPELENEQTREDGSGRRRFLGYLMAAPVLVAAAEMGRGILGDAAGPLAAPKAQALPSNPQVADIYDLSDALSDSALPTSNLITVQINPDGTATHECVRTEVGQGVQTAFAMIIAEELDLPIEKVDIKFADARPELMFNQLTGGSNSVRSQYYPLRVACAIAKGRLLEVAAAEMDFAMSELTGTAGKIIHVASGMSMSYGELATKAASTETKPVRAVLKPESEFKILGKPTGRVDAHDIVTGKKVFATDIDMPDAWPTMVCRPPTVNGTVKSVNNLAKIQKMPGVSDIATITTGVAVRARTFGQCIDAIRAMDVTWNPGPVEGTSDESIEQELKEAALPFLVPALPGTKTFDYELTTTFRSNAPLEPNTAIADVKAHSAEIWVGAKMPITAQGDVARQTGLPLSAVKVHVITTGGSFGRRLFNDGALDAAEASQAMGKPVRLMWARSDEFRQGRGHPMAHQRIRVHHDGKGGVLAFEQRYTGVRADYTHSFGDAIAGTYTRLPVPGEGLTLAEAIFELTAILPYNFGITKMLLNETRQSPAEQKRGATFNTTAMRQVYSPDVVAAHELAVDKLANELGKDRLEFRLENAKNDKFKEVIQKAAEIGGWGRKLPAGMGQGIGVHEEYKQHSACFVEIDARPETVNRKIPGASTGPRVTRAVFVTTVGRKLINPLGAEAQLQGGTMDGIGLALNTGLHLKNGSFLEGSYDDYHYTRQWNVPRGVEIHLLPEDPMSEVGGFGEVGVAPSLAATACAYGAAVGKIPTYLPVMHHTPGFDPKPLVPPIPPSPTDGLEYYPAPSEHFKK